MSKLKRKILIIVENLPVPFDTRVWQEATTLVENGYTVSIICPTGKGFTKKYEMINGVHIYRHDMPEEGNGFLGYVREYGVALYEELRLARKIYKEVGFDVIHGCNPPDNLFLIALAFRRYKVEYIFDHHDICPELYLAKFGEKGLLYQSQILLERLTYKYAKMAFVTNESYKEIAVGRNKMNPKDVFVLRSGPKVERLRITEANPIRKRGKKFMIGYVGVIGQQEGMDYLVDAAKYIKEELKRDDICFTICGGGPYLDTIRQIAVDKGVDDIVEFTGRIADDELLDILNSADVCVNPDEFNEMNDKSTMNKVLEYMALGKPIVQFDLKEGRVSAASASLYAKNNDYVDMANKIVDLLEDEELREHMSAVGKHRIHNELSWNHTHKGLLDGYDYFYHNYA